MRYDYSIHRNEYSPGLHVCLTVLLRCRVVVFKRTQTCAGHEEVHDVLHVLDVLLGHILKRDHFNERNARSLYLQNTHTEDLENLVIAAD